MPIYGFECSECQHHFEVILPMSKSDSAPPPCEACGCERTARKLGTAMAVIGSGGDRKVVGGSNCGSCSTKSASACSSCKH